MGDSTNASLNVRYYKETEWLKTGNVVEKDSKCFFHNFYLNVAAEPLNVKPWSDDYILHFNEIVRVKLISQIKTYSQRDPMILMMNKSYIPRKSIETPHFS
ncbi:MAG: hypothetical protein ABF289_05540 [Clostridiales bacterium]